MNGNWGVTYAIPVEWVRIAVIENWCSAAAPANGPLTNETVTGSAWARA